MVKDRSSDILEAAIREFIKTGDPISSSLLYDRYDFGIKPATIRNELQTLTERGFLDQPYHSAGRVPSDRGYQFFVEQILSKDEPKVSSDDSLESLFRRAKWDDLAEVLSHDLGVLGVVDDLERKEVYKEGLDNLLEQLDWHFPEDIKQVVRDFEHLEERLSSARSFFDDMEESVNVFIGRRSPITKSDQLSVVIGDYKDGGRRVALLAIGPKRMNYQKVIGILKSF